MTEQELLQEALEWREHIAKLAGDYSDQELFRKRLATFEWLIKQAERVQKLEKDLDETLDIGLKMEGEANEWERKAKRYKQALETIRNMFPMRGGTSYDKLSQIRKTAEKALEGDD